MKTRQSRAIGKSASATIGLAMAMMTASVAQAHTSFEIDKAVAERSFKAILQVPHGCDGKATTEVQVKLPEGFVFAKPQPKAGWQLEILKGDYKKSYDNHGTAVTSGPLEIRWKNGDLSDEYYDTFVITGKISGIDAGTVLAFPVTQLCGAEASVSWTEIAKEGENAHDLKSPAPTVTVTAAGADGGHDHNAMAMGASADGQTVKAGALEISGGGVKAMLPGAKVGGGGLVIRNTGSAADRLVSVTSPAAGRVELHEQTMVGDVMKMRPVKDGVAVPAGETVELTGNLHLMFMEVKSAFAEGQTVPVTLTFEKTGNVDYALPVGNAAGKQK